MPTQEHFAHMHRFWQVLLAIAAFIVASRFFTPGFFDPLVPSHSDVWRYYAYSQEAVLPNLITSPRPVMLILIKLLGVLPDFRWFTAGLLLPAVLVPVFLVSWAERVTSTRWALVPTFIYFFLCFALESYYELQLLDFGGCFAVILGVLALNKLDTIARTSPSSKPIGAIWGAMLVLAWLSMEAKPTYALVMAGAPFLYAGRVGLRKCIALSGSILAVVFAVLVKDKVMGSPFLDTTSAESSYRLAHDVSAILGSFWFYTSRILPAATWPLSLLGLVLLGRAHGWKAPLALAVLAVLAVLPMVAIPNNRLSMYSWFGSSLILLAVPMIFIYAADRWRLASRLVSVPLLFAGLWGIAVAEPTARYWYESNQIANGHMLKSLASLQAYVRPGAKVLMAGAHNAFSPLKNDAFVRSRFRHELDWKVTVPKSDLSLITGSRDTQRLVPAGEVIPQNFDLVAYFARDGRLLRIGPAAELVPLPAEQRLAQMLCQEALADPVPCLNQVGESEASAAIAASKVGAGPAAGPPPPVSG
ncbi:hypothetical protein [Pseudoxanthomonas mexicana]|uniref:hypothetical protein n=1 Tax=Pseudoxanthomonas mexicana TaxID=128785 RepID=UPI00289EBF91|nr:hypothetical protein [Pseudoxanthomonas mexicana]